MLAVLLSGSAMAQMIENPMLWADVPDPDVIRVGDTFYMVSTTMHLMPGGPIMASKDLKNWETVGYIFDQVRYAGGNCVWTRPVGYLAEVSRR